MADKDEAIIALKKDLEMAELKKKIRDLAPKNDTDVELENLEKKKRILSQREEIRDMEPKVEKTKEIPFAQMSNITPN